MFDDFFADHLKTLPVIGIFRGATPERTLELTRTAWNAGVELVEVPVQTEDAMPSLIAAIDAARPRGALIGAGTVTTVRQLDTVLDAGAAFIVSPGLHPAVVDECIRRGVPILPGVATSSEIAAASERGLTWLKAFPAAQLTSGWIAAQHGPFPHIRFVGTGGMSATNAREYLDAGCSAIAVASAFNTPAGIDALRHAVLVETTA